MNEREIFAKAIEIRDSQQRDTFLKEACDGDTSLRKRLDELLDSHARASGFLQVPVVDQLLPREMSQPIPTIELPPPSQVTQKDVHPSAQDDHGDETPNQTDLSFLQPSTKAGSIGRLGHYEILKIIGQGAFGIVFKAFDEKLHRHVAVKAMSPQLASTSPPRKRFLREARSVAAINHDNIVQVHAVEEQPLPYLVMEFVDGQTLQQKLDGAGPLDVPEILHLGRQMAAGLAAAHEKGLIHRDIKPGNILLEAGADQKVKITDFGLARAADDATMTRTGTIAGTPMYMAPEQALGQTLDHRADLFSLGSVLYQMTCGRPPFRANNTISVLKRLIDEEPRPIQDILPDMPGWLCTIIAKLHAKNPDQRFQSARELADLFARCQSELQLHGHVSCVDAKKPTVASSSRFSELGKHFADASRRPIVLATAACVMLAFVVVGLGVTEFTGLTHFFGRTPDLPSLAVATDPAPSTASKSNTSNTIARDSQPPSTLPLRRDVQPTDGPPPAISPFDSAQAKNHQEAWAKHLGVPVEFTNSIGMEFRLIPPGEFTMGMAKEEAEELAALNPNDEQSTQWLSSAPTHKVRLTQAYYLGTYEVTQEQYEKVAGINPSYFSLKGEGKEGVKDEDARQHPVEMVRYIDAAEYCIKLSQKEMLEPVYFNQNSTITIVPGDGYRLPTEAEWEWACRAGTQTSWFHGEHEGALRMVAWFSANSFGKTHAVGKLKANPFGLCDVHGNVCEWCQDWYSPYASRETTDPSGPSIGLARVVRGGSWLFNANSCRSAFRFGATGSGSSYGFRLALSIVGVQGDSGPGNKK